MSTMEDEVHEEEYPQEDEHSYIANHTLAASGLMPGELFSAKIPPAWNGEKDHFSRINS